MKKLLFLILLIPFFVNAQQQVINVGTSANDHTGDQLRSAFIKTNANFTELYGQAVISCTASGTNTYTSSPTPPISSYVNGQKFLVTFTNANTGSSTLNISGIGSVALKKFSSGSLANLSSADISNGSQFLVSYDVTNSVFQISIPGSGTGGSGTVNSGTANQIAYYSSTGSAVSGTNAIPNGTTATTQSVGDNSTKVATTAFVLANAGSGGTVSTFAESLAGTNDAHFMSPLKNNYVNARVYNVEAYGAVHDGVVIRNNLFSGSGISCTSGSAVISNSDGLFTSAMVGKTITLSGAGTSGAPLKTTVLSFSTSSSITLSTNALTTVSSAYAIIGTDDTAAIQSAINACHTAGGGNVYFPNGIYIIGGSLVTSANGGNPNCQIYMPALADALINTKETSVNLIGESYPNRSTFGTGVQLYSTLVTVSGSNPSVIGTIGDATNLNNLSYSDLLLKNIEVVVWTNAGAHAPYLSGINFAKSAQNSLSHVTISIDIPLSSSTTPVGSGTFGIFGGLVNNFGPNVYEELEVVGFEYGFIPAEHTHIRKAVAVGNANGFVILRAGHAVTGGIICQANINHILFPSASTFLGYPNNAGAGAQIDLIIEAEINTNGKWFDVQTLLNDTGNFGAGRLSLQTTDAPSATTLYNSMVTGSLSGFQLNVVQFTSLLGKRANQAGGPITVTYGSGNAAYGQNSAVLEINSGTTATATDNFATLSLTSDQSNTSSGSVSNINVLNKAISATDKRLYSLITETNGAINTAKISEFVMSAGTSTATKVTTASLYDILIPVKLDNLAGTGQRQVVTDASGNLSATSGLKLSTVTKTANYTATTNDYTIRCNNGTFTIALPAASTVNGLILYIKKVDASGTVTIDPNGSETIDGITTATINTQWSWLGIQSNGTSWDVISQ